jgi:nucleoside-diphosphate-sugar epimerase
MRIFLTGATGFIGSAIVPELIGVGHEVLGLTRSEAGAEALAAAGAEAHRGDIEDLDSLRSGAAEADGVIHTAFNHDFSRFAENCAADRRAIEALGEALAGSDRPLLVTSGTAIGNDVPGRLALETDRAAPDHPNPRVASELAAEALLQAGLNVVVVRLPQVHDPLKFGLISPAIALAREKGVSAYLGDGSNRWSAAHVLDVARLYRLALEAREPGAHYHAVAEEGVPMRAIAEIIGRGLNVPVTALPPEEAAAHFGWLAAFAGRDLPASGKWTQARLGWHPAGPDMLADLEQLRWVDA